MRIMANFPLPSLWDFSTLISLSFLGSSVLNLDHPTLLPTLLNRDIKKLRITKFLDPRNDLAQLSHFVSSQGHPRVREVSRLQDLGRSHFMASPALS